MSTPATNTTKPAAPTAAPAAGGATAPGATTGTVSIEKLIQSPEFAWFGTHVVAIVSYLLSLFFRKSAALGGILTRITFLSEAASFGIILFEKYGTRFNYRQLLVDDNAHYFSLALVWLLSSYRLFAAAPFVIYSLFHALTYARAYLLPAFGYPQTSNVSRAIESFIKTRNGQFTTLASGLELFILLRLFVGLLSFKKGSILLFVVYAVFFRLRYAVSGYTRNVVHQAEVHVDSIVNNPNLPPVVKETWVKTKGAVAQTPGPSKIN